MKEEAASGAAWILVDRILGQGLGFAAFILLAHLLSPSDYGILALATAIVEVPAVLLNEGFSTALIQRRGISEDHVAAALWANVALGVLLTALLAVGGGWAASLAGEPMLAPVLRALSPVLVMTGAAAVAGGLFLRSLRYQAFALRTLIAQTASASAAVAFALLGFGVWALVVQKLSYVAVSLVVLWAAVRVRPRPVFQRGAFQDLVRFSARSMAANLLRLVALRADVVIVGLLFPAAALGFYNLAQRLTGALQAFTLLPVSGVMLPVFSRMQDEPERFRSAYLRLLWAGASVWVPAAAGLGAVAPRLVPLVFGAQWRGAAILVMVMSAAAVPLSLTLPTREVLLSLNRAGTYAALNALQLLLTLVLFPIGARHGILGCGAAALAASLLVVPFHLRAVTRALGVSGGEIAFRLAPVFAVGGLMALAAYGVGEWAAGGGLLTLGLQIAVGVPLYGGLLYAVKPAETSDVLRLALRRRGPAE